MKTLVRWAVRLYPAAWRARYGVEMGSAVGGRWLWRRRLVGYRARSTEYADDEHPDHWKAQAVTRDLVNRFFTGPQHATEVLDPPNLPATPVYPNRLNIAVLGTVAGILLGLTASYQLCLYLAHIHEWPKSHQTHLHWLNEAKQFKRP